LKLHRFPYQMAEVDNLDDGSPLSLAPSKSMDIIPKIRSDSILDNEP
jgi:hypothetical protein